MSVIKVFYGREDRIAEISDEAERVQYKDTAEDISKLDKALRLFQEEFDNLEDKIDDYALAMAESDEDVTGDLETEAGVILCRNNLVEAWAHAQASLSKVAWVARIDGNTAFHRLVDGIKYKNRVDMSGL